MYEELLTRYDIPDNVELFDLGCLSLNMIERVREYDVIIRWMQLTAPIADPGTVFRFEPDAMRAIRGQQRRCTISSWSTCSTPHRN